MLDRMSGRVRCPQIQGDLMKAGKKCRILVTHGHKSLLRECVGVYRTIIEEETFYVIQSRGVCWNRADVRRMICFSVIPTPNGLHAQGPAFESRPIASVMQKESLSAAGVISVWNFQSNVGVTTSADGEFLYVSAYGSACINVFRRDRETGAAALIQTIVDRKNLAGVTDLTFSSDEKFAVASAFTSKTAVLYRRDASSGSWNKYRWQRIKRMAYRDWTGYPRVISPDSRFVYVANCGKNQQRKFTNGSITSFRIGDNDQLELLEVFQGEDQCFDNVRGLVMLSDGKTLLATSSAAKCLVVIDRSTDTGKLSVRQVIRDEENGVHGLDGAMFIATSPDEKFVYTSSGRFQGDHALACMRWIGSHVFNWFKSLSTAKRD